MNIQKISVFLFIIVHFFDLQSSDSNHFLIVDPQSSDLSNHSIVGSYTSNSSSFHNSTIGPLSNHSIASNQSALSNQSMLSNQLPKNYIKKQPKIKKHTKTLNQSSADRNKQCIDLHTIKAIHMAQIQRVQKILKLYHKKYDPNAYTQSNDKDEVWIRNGYTQAILESVQKYTLPQDIQPNTKRETRRIHQLCLTQNKIINSLIQRLKES